LNQADENAKNAGSAPDEGDMLDTDLDTDKEGLEEQAQSGDASKAAVPAVAKAAERTGDKKSGKAKPVKKDSLLAEVSAEFKKIVWPTRRELVKQTTTVIVVALMFGVIIFAMDSVFGFGINSFIDRVIS